MRRPVLPALVAACAAVVLLGGCGPSPSGASAGNTAVSSGSPAASGAVTGGITVFAAASLTGSFTTLGQRFQAAHPGTKVTFSFGASSTLATQVVQGAPADVFASASGTNMQQVVSDGATTSPAPFARNVMEIAVPPGNPARISSVADLARPGVKVALCAAAVPCGAVARQVFGKAGVTVTPVTEEADVKATLTKVELGEVDAGVVYVTDVRAAGTKVTGVAIPDTVNAATTYPIAVLQGSRNRALAEEFVDYVLSVDGAGVLTAAGFTRP